MNHMPHNENKMMRKRLANAYLSSVISISLVLILVGIAALLVVNARRVSDYFKENMQVSILMKQEVSDAQVYSFKDSVAALPFIRTARVVTREEGTEDLKEMLGEDFLDVFETSPVPVSVEVTLQAGYVSSDSLAVIVPMLGTSRLVDEVGCQQSLVDALNTNLARISMVLGIFILLLLFISYVLINNTVRLSVYSRRFTIHTMKLVGATRSFIRRPFVRNAIVQGLVASVLAIAALCAMLLAVRRSFPALFGIFSKELIALVMGVVLLCGVAICVVSTFFVVNRLAGSTREELYY